MNRFQPRPAGVRPARPLSGMTQARLRAAALVLAALTATAVAAGCTAPTAGPTAPASGAPASTHTPAASTSPSTTAVPPCNVYKSSPPPLPGSLNVATAGPFVAKIKARGYLVAGVDANTYGFEYYNPDTGTYQGFDIDMIKAVAQAIFGNPNQVRYKAITDAEREPDLENSSVDIVAHTMSIRCDRLQDVDFSTVYFDAHQQILVLDGSTVTGPASLAGKKVCATGGSDSMGGIAAYHPIPVLVPYITDCLVKLQQGQVAAITSDNSILEGLERQDVYTKIVGPPLEDEPYGLAIAKTNPDFVRFVNAVLQNEFASGAWKASYVHWVGPTAPQPPTPEYAS